MSIPYGTKIYYFRNIWYVNSNDGEIVKLV